MKIRSLFLCGLMFATVSLVQQVSFAAIIVSFGGPVSILAGGGTGSMDVYVSSSDGLDNLDLFSAEFLLTPLGGAANGGIQFSPVQSESQLSDASYVHFGNSAGSPVGNASGATYIGGDSTLDLAGTLLPQDPLNLLLFRLDLSTLTAMEGDQYEISLVNSANTFFLDENLDDLIVDIGSFSSTGIINVGAAVPEPAGFVYLGLGGWLVLGAVRHWQRSRQAA